jgi:thiol-disulfide isomerase/thioredoxin
MIGAIIAALVVVALVVAVLASGGDDDGGEAQSPATTTATGGGSGTTSAPATDAVGPAEQQPVTVQGTDLVPLEDEDDDAAVGATPPTVDGFTFDGTPMRIAPGGTAKMVVFLAHWCPHCNAEIPIILDWAEEGMVPDGLEIVGVATGTDDTAPNYPPSTWLQELGWTFDTLADSPEFRAAQAYGVTGFPFFAIVGEDGTVLGRFSGEKPLEELDATVRGALGV